MLLLDIIRTLYDFSYCPCLVLLIDIIVVKILILFLYTVGSIFYLLHSHTLIFSVIIACIYALSQSSICWILTLNIGIYSVFSILHNLAFSLF